jgi:hypothetical protein
MRTSTTRPPSDPTRAAVRSGPAKDCVSRA